MQNLIHSEQIQLLQSLGNDPNDIGLWYLALLYSLQYEPRQDTVDLFIAHKLVFYDYSKNRYLLKQPVQEYDINEYRTIFKGIRPGSIGQKSAIKNMMDGFRELNPQYSWADIINATIRAYDKFGPQYMPNADNFIIKYLEQVLEDKELDSNNIETII